MDQPKSERRAMELEVVNVASVEFTKKIQRERTRKHHLDEKLQRVKQQIQARQRELLHSRKKVQCHKGSGVQQLEKRLQALRTKYSVATTGNVKLRERVDHLRKEKESARQVHEQRTRELRHATVAFETLKKAVFQKQMETHTLIGQLDSLKISTLEDIHNSTGKFEGALEMALDRPRQRPHERKPEVGSVEESSAAANASVDRTALDNAQKDLLLSQYMVHEKATELQKLIDDHVAVKLAMETMHSLRDECGLSDDAQVIEEFEATEEANYTECKMVNTLLREEAMLVKEKSVLVDLVAKSKDQRRRKKKAAAPVDDSDADVATANTTNGGGGGGDGASAGRPPPFGAAVVDDDDDLEEEEESDELKALGEIENKRAEHEDAVEENEDVIGSVQGIMSTLAATLANKTSKKEDKEAYFTHATVMEALSQIEDRVDLIVRMTSIAKADDDEGPTTPGLLPSLQTATSTRSTKQSPGNPGDPGIKTKLQARRASVAALARMSSSKAAPGTKQPFFWPPPPTAESDDEDNVDRPFSLKQLRTKAVKSEHAGDVREAFEHEKHAKMAHGLHPDLADLGLNLNIPTGA